MNHDFFMEEKDFEIQIQLEKRRKIYILKYISIEKRWYTFDEISKRLNTSIKTISRDLSVIKDLMPKGWDIKIKKGYGIQLIMPINATITEIICKIFRNSLTFQVLNSLLHNKDITVSKIAENLFIQPCVVTKTLKKIEKDIAIFGLRLRRKPLNIVGGDWNILNMFTELYSQAYLSSDWPFEYDKETILRFIRKIETSTGMILSLSSRRKLSYFIAILFIRKQNGYNVQLTDNLLNLDIHTPMYKEIFILSEEIQTFFNINFLYSEKLILTIAYRCLDYKYVNPLKEKEKELHFFKEQKLTIYNLVRDFINMLDNKLGTQFIINDDFIYLLINYFRKKINLLHIDFYIKSTDKENVVYIKRKYIKTYLQVKDVYNKWIKKYKIAKYIPSDEILNIVLHVESNLITLNIQPKRAIIVTKEGIFWENYISAILKEKFGNKLEFLPSSLLNIRKGCDIEKDDRVDFIISTLSLEKNLNPVILIQPTLTKRDLSNIEHYIN